MIIFRYLTKEILTTLFAATLILLLLFVTNQSVQFLQKAASGDIPVTEILQLIVLQVPLLLGYLLPLGLYLGILLTLGRLYVESEMTVLFSCGLSRAKLMMMVLILATVIASIVAWLMAVVVPNAQGQINYIFSKAEVTASAAKVIPGKFMTFGKSNDQMVFYAGRVENHFLMHDVFMAKQLKNDRNLPSKTWNIVVAKTAFEQKLSDQNENYLILNHGYRYIGVPGHRKFQELEFDQYGMRLTPKYVPDYNEVQYDSVSHLLGSFFSNSEAAAELQWRLAMPISVFLFAMIAVSLGEVRPRYGKFTQLFPAMIIYAGYADLIFLSRTWIRSGELSPLLGMWWVHGIALFIAAALILFRANWYHT